MTAFDQHDIAPLTATRATRGWPRAAIVALFAAITTAASCGAVNAMHDSFMPLGGLVPMWLIQFGEVVFGGVGSGLYGLLVLAIITVFVAGLMVGRTPEYVGKKIGGREIKFASLYFLVTPTLVLAGTAAASHPARARATAVAGWSGTSIRLRNRP